MKLTNELRDKLNNAKSEEERKDILANTRQNVKDAGIVLEDSELDEVSGGGSGMRHIDNPYITSM